MENSNDITMEKLLAELQTLKEKSNDMQEARKDQLSIAVVSGDMDKIRATMIISLAAATRDTQVKLFFSFWALAALRDPKKNPKGKDFISKMFGWMLPNGRNKLKLSKMNMMGMGPVMIKGLLKKHHILSFVECFSRQVNSV